MSSNIDTRYEMLRAGFKQTGTSNCKDCHKPVVWWKTRNGKNICYDNPMPESDQALVQPHWITCPAKQDRFDREKTKAVGELRRSTKARVVVALYDDGHAWASGTGISGDDLRHELITAANKIRNEMGGR